MGLLNDMVVYVFQIITRKHDLIFSNIIKNVSLYNNIYLFSNLATHIFHNITSNSHSCRLWSSNTICLKKYDMFFESNTKNMGFL